MSDTEKYDWTEHWQEHWKYYGAILLIALIAFIIGYRLEAAHLTLPAHIFNEIGVAAVIAILLTATIERLSAKEFIGLARRQQTAIVEQSKQLAAQERQQAKEDVFYYVYGSMVPTKITDEIKTQILKARFVRKNVSMSYTLTPIIDEQTRCKYILLDLEMSYDIENLTTNIENFVIAATIEASPVASLEHHSKFLSISAVNCEGAFNISGEEIQTVKEDMDICLKPDRVIGILPNVQTLARLTFRSQTVKHLEGGSDYFRFGHHTCDLDLTVQVIGDPLKVYAYTFAPNLKPVPTNRHKPENKYYNWTVPKPLLAFQGVYVTWTPESELSADAALSRVPEVAVAAAPYVAQGNLEKKQ